MGDVGLLLPAISKNVLGVFERPNGPDSTSKAVAEGLLVDGRHGDLVGVYGGSFFATDGAALLGAVGVAVVRLGYLQFLPGQGSRFH